VAVREGNDILGVDACDPDRPPVTIRYLVDPDVPGAEITLSRSGKTYRVRCKHLYTVLMVIYSFLLS